MKKKARQMVFPVILMVIIYLSIGYALFPPLLLPIGCDGVRGDIAVGYTPSTTFAISYDDGDNSLHVEHIGGATLSAEATNELTLLLTSSDSQTSYPWSSAGGTYPIREGDSVTLSNATVNGDELGQGDTIRVIWNGTWTDPQPNYCPNSGGEYTSTVVLGIQEI